ncbi:MAG: caspase family protein [Hyphomicrobiales bacterium]|nr:caspase family protein [Hyphomicrobiales bacterium]
MTATLVDRRRRGRAGSALASLAVLAAAFLAPPAAARDSFVPSDLSSGSSHFRSTGAPATTVTWRRWENPRFRFSVDLPSSLVAEPPPENGDGITLRSKDRSIEVRVYGQHNVAGVDLDKARTTIRAGLPGATFDYERVFADNFVLSGTRDKEGFYVRVWLSPDRSVATLLLISHPRALTQANSELVTRLSKSLVPAPGGEPVVASEPPPPPPPPPQPPADPPKPAVPPVTPLSHSASELERLKLQAEIERLKLEQLKLGKASPAAAASEDDRKPPVAVAPKGRRVALVIGNGAYVGAPKLPTSAADAARMSTMLSALGFEVTSGVDLARSAMTADLARFYAAAQGAEVALFYFSGHGVQVNGHNYLLPIDARFDDPQAALDVDGRAVDLQKFINAASGARTVLAFVDACRDNPIVEENLAKTFYKGVGGPTKGLAVVRKEDLGTGQFVGFAADEGKTAQTGDGAVSVYTAALLKILPTPGVDISVLHRRVRRQVEEATRGQQSPRAVDDLREALYLATSAK